MGGFGSGMAYGPKKLTLNDLSAIDAALIKERLREQQTFTITWGDRVRQSFRAAESTLYAIELGQIIEIERTACYFGGERFWFRCPYCDSRWRKLYLSHCGMECRGCPVVSACSDGSCPTGLSSCGRKEPTTQDAYTRRVRCQPR